MDFGKERKIFGRLGSLSLADIVQLLGVNRKTVTLSLDSEGERGEIYFKDGIVIHASVGDVEGEDAILELLDWVDAGFVIEEGIVSVPKSTISRDAETLMLIVANKWDEARRGSSFEDAGAGSMGTDVKGTGAKAEEDRTERMEWANRELLSMARQSERRRLTIPVVLILAFGIILPSAYFLARFLGKSRTSPVTAESSTSPSELEMELEAGNETTPTPTTTIEERSDINENDGDDPGAEEAAPEPPPAPTSAPNAAPEGFGYLLATVEPWAEVFVDGRKLGETPMDRIRLSEGEHTLTLSNENYAGVITDTVSIPRDATFTKKYSFNEFGYLQVVVRPWAEVHIDGRFIGQTPLGRLKIPVGHHSITLRHPDLGEKQAEVDIQLSQTSLLKIEM